MACRAIAELCDFYGIPVTPKTVLNHGEVQSILGVEQRGKWDVMVLPWSPGLSWEMVGNKFRERVSYYLWELGRMENKEPEPGITKTALATVTARSGLRLRSGPGTNYSIMGVLPFGKQVEIEDYDQFVTMDYDWVLVRASGYPTGYAHSDWLDFSENAPKG